MTMEFRELARLNGGYVESRILHAAVTLGIFDALDASGRSGDDVGRALGTDARATTLLLNALVAMRLVRKRGEQFLETDTGRTYLTTTSKSWAGSCRDLTVTLRDGTTHRARFTFTK